MVAPVLVRPLSRPQLYVCSRCLRRQSLLKTPKRFKNKYAKPKPPTSKLLETQPVSSRRTEIQQEWEVQVEEIKAGKKKSMLGVLEERGFINSIAGDRDSLDKLMTEKRVGAYVGIDPTAPSMHVGHLLPFMALFWMYVYNFRVVSLLGGATAAIGDPTGRTTSREVLDDETRQSNLDGIVMQLKRLWTNVDAYASKWGYERKSSWKGELLNNNSWMKTLSFIEVLKHLGSGMRLGAMLSRDTVRNKMEKGDGMSFAEFSYPLLQAWDWWHLYNRKNIQVQIGGSDQYGNIVAGIDAIKYISKNHTDRDKRWPDKEDPRLIPYGFTVPLLTTASGQKFGKSAGNAIWLDKEKTSVFELYQFFVRTADADVERYLKLFTFMPLDRIRTLMDEHHQAPERRAAQHVLAQEFVELVHGKEEAEQASAEHRMRFSKAQAPAISPSQEQGLLSEVSNSGSARPVTAPRAPKIDLTLPRSLVVRQPLAKVLQSAGVSRSRSEGGRFIISGGVYIGNRPDAAGSAGGMFEWQNAQKFGGMITEDFIPKNGIIAFRHGKWNLKVVKLVCDEEYEALDLDAPGWQALKEQKETQSV